MYLKTVSCRDVPLFFFNVEGQQEQKVNIMSKKNKNFTILPYFTLTTSSFVTASEFGTSSRVYSDNVPIQCDSISRVRIYLTNRTIYCFTSKTSLVHFMSSYKYKIWITTTFIASWAQQSFPIFAPSAVPVGTLERNKRLQVSWFCSIWSNSLSACPCLKSYFFCIGYSYSKMDTFVVSSIVL